MLKMLIYLLTFVLPFSHTFEENQWIKEWPLVLDKYFIVSIQFHGNLGTYNPVETSFLRLEHNSSLPLHYSPIKGHVCSGVIINRFTIITAAHCVLKSQKEHYTVKISDPIWDAGSKAYQVDEIIIHEKFKPLKARIPNDRLIHDIALILLKQTLDFELAEETIKLADENINMDMEAKAHSVVFLLKSSH